MFATALPTTPDHGRPQLHPAWRENMPRYPNVTVQLSGEDGNVFFIIGRTRRALSQAGVNRDALDQFTREAMSGDYDHALQTVMRWVETR